MGANHILGYRPKHNEHFKGPNMEHLVQFLKILEHVYTYFIKKTNNKIEYSHILDLGPSYEKDQTGR